MNDVVTFFVGVLVLIFTGISAVFERLPAWFWFVLIPFYFVFRMMIGFVTDQLGHLRVALEDISENLSAQNVTLTDIRKELDGSAARERAEVVEFARSFRRDILSGENDDPPSPDPLGRPGFPPYEPGKGR